MAKDALSPWKRRLLTGLLWLGVIVGGGVALHTFLRKPGDIELHAKAGQRLLEGEPIFRNESPAWPYPPFLAVLQTPVPSIPPASRRLVWDIISVGLLVVSLLRIRSMFAEDVPTSSARFVSGLLTLGVASIYLVIPIDAPGHDLLILFLTIFGIDAWRRGEPIQSGVWFGIGAACKATPLLFALMLAVQRRWMATAVMLMTTVGLTLVPDLAFPQKSGEMWVVSWYRTHLSTLRPDEPANAAGAWHRWNPKNQNLSGTLYRLGTPAPEEENVPGFEGVPMSPAVLRGLTLGSQAVLGILLVWLAWPRPSNAQNLSRIALASAFACAMVLLSPMSSKSHFAVLVLPVAVLSARVILGIASPLAWLSMAAIGGLGWMTSRDAFGDRFSDMAQAYGCVAAASLIALVSMIPAVLKGGKLAQPSANPVSPPATTSSVSAPAAAEFLKTMSGKTPPK